VRSEQLAALVLRYALPAISAHREFTMAGGLFSYGTSLVDIFRQLGVYTAKILKGENPAEFPGLPIHKNRADHQSQDREAAWSLQSHDRQGAALKRAG
jgi:hypothetical protein